MEQFNTTNPPVVQPAPVAPAAPGSALLKVSGILMIIFGSIGIITSLVVKLGMAVGEAITTSEPQVSSALGSLNTGSTFQILSAVLTLVAGILAVVLRNKIGKAMPVIIFSGLVILLTLISQIMWVSGVNSLKDALATIDDVTFKAPSFGFTNILAILSSVALPVLAIIGGLKNQSAKR